MAIPKIDKNGIFLAPKLTVVRKGQPLVEVAVPPVIHEVPVPVNPTRELCNFLYPPTPPPDPPQPPEPPDIGDWDKDWPVPDMQFWPPITKFSPYGIDYIASKDSGLSYPFAMVESNSGQPGVGGVVYPVLIIPPFSFIDEWLKYFLYRVPKGYPHAGTFDSIGLAGLSHLIIRRNLALYVSDFFALGQVEWSTEPIHGFNLVICTDSKNEPHLACYDISMGKTLTWVKPGMIMKFYGSHAGQPAPTRKKIGMPLAYERVDPNWYRPILGPGQWDTLPSLSIEEIDDVFRSVNLPLPGTYNNRPDPKSEWKVPPESTFSTHVGGWNKPWSLASGACITASLLNVLSIRSWCSNAAAFMFLSRTHAFNGSLVEKDGKIKIIWWDGTPYKPFTEITDATHDPALTGIYGVTSTSLV